MACYYDAEPCEEQKGFMEDLGFVLKKTQEVDECPWSLEEDVDNMHTIYICLSLRICRRIV